MQNQGPPYQGGPVNQGNYPDHTYNSQMGHCPPGGYQPYANGPYTHGNSRAHHYGNHQMQQAPPRNQIPYGGNYGPPPNQYGAPPGQEMYRNPHHMYPGGNNRNMHGKPTWGENNSEMMPAYNHGPPHQPMMNNSAPMSMRSPPHLATNVHSPGSQHYRQMQSPGHSPQTWPQVQVPSPGMHPVARTTPSPLQAHARSPGHSQPFSPSAVTHMPAAVNMPSHPIPSVVPESPQPAQVVNQGMMAAGPLHSLQKMVMLDQDNPMPMNCDMVNENSCDRLPQCVPNSVTPVEKSPREDSKDSFATYYNMDENRLESKPQTNVSFQSSDYTLNSSSSEVPPSLINERLELGSDLQQPTDVPVKQPHYSNSSTTQPRSFGNLPNGLPSSHPNIISLKKADVSEKLSNDVYLPSTNKTQNSRSATDMPTEMSEKTDVAQDSMADSEKDSTKEAQRNGPVILCNSDSHEEEEDKTSSEALPPNVEESTSAQSSVSAQCTNDTMEASDSSIQVPVSEEDVVIKKEPVAEEDLSVEKKENPEKLPKELASNSSGINTNVMVVIHRIRKDDTNDTWHVPNSDPSKSTNVAARSNKIGPQIIKLTPTTSESGDLLTTIKTESEEESKPTLNSTDAPTPVTSKVKRKNNAISEAKSLSKPTAAKRSRQNGPKSKGSPIKKKRRAKGKLSRKKKPEVIDLELPPPKPKKQQKPFAGPYIRVAGPKANPSSFTIVNVAIKEEEKGKIIRTKTTEGGSVKKPRVGHTSTLSPHYDAFNKDRTWLCAFCVRGSHCNGLGDLYGPYYVKSEAALLSTSKSASSCSKSSTRSKRRKSDASTSEACKVSQNLPKKTPKQVSKETTFAEPTATPLSSHTASTLQSNSPSEDKNLHEVWIHEDCAVWCQGVSLMGVQIYGLEEAIKEASENICSSCKATGATLGCWRKGCAEQYHFCCAKEKGCKLDMEKFSLFCPKHKEGRALATVAAEKQKRTQ